MARTAAEVPDVGLAALLRGTGSMRLAATLAAFTAGNALTEGAGLVLLVPMLATLGAQNAAATGLAGRLSQFGLDLGLENLLIAFIALVTARALLMAGRDMAAMRLEAQVIDRLRLRAWRALVRCDWRHLAAMRQSDTASLLISNIDRVGTGINQAIQLGTSGTTLVSVALAALAIAPQVAVGAVLGGALVLFAYRGMRRRAATLGQQLGLAYREIHGGLSEGLGALRLIKSFGAEAASAHRMSAAFGSLRRAQRTYVRDAGVARVVFQTGGALLLALLVWLAIRRWGLGAAAVLPAVAVFARALPLLGAVQEGWQNWSHVRPALAETLSLIRRTEAHAEGDEVPHAETLPAAPCPIELDGVTVRYEGRSEPALADVTLSIAPGSLVSLTGPSGAGKSTLADVLCGLTGPDAGALRVGGTPVAGPLRRAWRARVAYVQQDPLLFHASIRENLLWSAPEASDAALREALEAASALFVLTLPDGLDTVVGDRGVRLSGGERQRIALARGLLRHPDLLILDEVTSALDAANEAAVSAAIARLKGRLTIVTIGHRGALAELSDRTVALAGGRVVNDAPTTAGAYGD